MSIHACEIRAIKIFEILIFRASSKICDFQSQFLTSRWARANFEPYVQVVHIKHYVHVALQVCVDSRVRGTGDQKFRKFDFAREFKIFEFLIAILSIALRAHELRTARASSAH